MYFCWYSIRTNFRILRDYGLEVLEDYVPSNAPDSTRVFVNGVWVGVHRDPAALVDFMRELRRSGDLSQKYLSFEILEKKNSKFSLMLVVFTVHFSLLTIIQIQKPRGIEDYQRTR